MYRILLQILVFMSLGIVVAHAQQNAETRSSIVLKGSIKDTLNFTNGGYASVSIIRASDSILQTFTRTDENGDFTLKVDSPATYLLIVSHPSFAIYIDPIELKVSTTLDPIIMTSKKQMLSEVVVTDAKAIVLKGDTIVYTADSFKTQQFANVDELLKKLPGIEIGKDGKIKAYGQEVKKMTVDGEEFFSDDPAIVSKTLRASAIDKVQVFDKKSDQAAFTGVDDGERIKTINLQLKDNAKKGYFGKAVAGGGPPDYWQNEAMINAFKGKQKIAAYGIMSNTNTNGLGWDDESKYGSTGGMFTEDDGVMYISSDNDDGDWDGQFSGSGLPKAWVAGALYNNKWNGDSLMFSSNYKFSKKMTESEENVNSHYILPDTEYFNTQHTDARNIVIRNNINTSLEYLIDTSSSIKVTLNGSQNKSSNWSNLKSRSADRNNVLINENDATQQNEKTDEALNADIFYKKRFSKKGRSFTANMKGRWTDADGDGTLVSQYNLAALDSNYVVDQRKQLNSNSVAAQLKLTYTEPLTKELNLQLNYGYGLNHNEAMNNSYDRQQDSSGYNDYIDPRYSSHFKMNVNQNQGGIGFRYNTKKLNVSIGSNISETIYNQEDKLYDTTYHYSYFNILPVASFRFNKSQTTSFTVRYTGKGQQPTLAQLQPYRNNNDPLNITIGNPDLKQTYVHSMSLNYNSYKMLSQQYVNVYVGLNVMNNDISQKQFVDNNGRSINQYVNVNGNYRSDFWLGWGRSFKDLHTGARLGGNYTHNNNFINNIANVNNQYTLRPSLNLSYSKDTTWDISYSFDPTYNYNASSIRTDVVTKYWLVQQQLSGNVMLPHKFKVGTDLNLSLRQRLNSSETHNNVLLWNAYISKAFLKDRSLEAKIYANDLLNQNIGYNRSNTPTYVSERTYNTIKRYVMFSLTWNFTKTGGKSKGEGVSDDMEISQ